MTIVLCFSFFCFFTDFHAFDPTIFDLFFHEADLQMVEANMVLALRKAKNQKEIGKQTATADLAARLQDALTRQEVIEQEMQIKVIERQREIKVQEEEVKKVDQELQANCIKPAEAEVYSALIKIGVKQFMSDVHVPSPLLGPHFAETW